MFSAPCYLSPSDARIPGNTTTIEALSWSAGTAPLTRTLRCFKRLSSTQLSEGVRHAERRLQWPGSTNGASQFRDSYCTHRMNLFNKCLYLNLVSAAILMSSESRLQSFDWKHHLLRSRVYHGCSPSLRGAFPQALPPLALTVPSAHRTNLLSRIVAAVGKIPDTEAPPPLAHADDVASAVITVASERHRSLDPRPANCCRIVSCITRIHRT